MACPNCNVTMHGMASNEVGGKLLIYWCPRCGCLLERRMTTGENGEETYFDTVVPAKWTQQDAGIPMSQRNLGLLYLLATDPFQIDTVNAHLLGKCGEAREAIRRMIAVDGLKVRFTY